MKMAGRPWSRLESSSKSWQPTYWTEELWPPSPFLGVRCSSEPIKTSTGSKKERDRRGPPRRCRNPVWSKWSPPKVGVLEGDAGQQSGQESAYLGVAVEQMFVV